MRKQELKEAFSKLHASDDLVTEVLDLKKNNNGHAWYIAGRAAVCAMVVAAIVLTAALWPKGEEPGAQLDAPTVGATVTTAPSATMPKTYFAAPGILKVYACNTKNVGGEKLEEYELSSDKPFLLALWNPLISASNFALPLTFQLPVDYFGTAEITYSVIAEYGGFGEDPLDYANYANQITISDGEQLYFGGDSLWNAAAEIGENGSFFADIIIYADEKIVGYGVISFCFIGATCYAHEFTTYCFPLIDGQVQDVSVEYIQQRISEYKENEHVAEVK